MSAGRLRGLVFGLRRAAADGVSDAELLRRYAAGGDEAAFELLVWRHAGLVLGVCRRVLRHEQDAEDAFQATWLALARRARTVARGGSVGGWLYKVASRAALRLRARAEARARRERNTQPPGATDPGDEADYRELSRALDEQIGRLPERYRAALVLRCLAGKSGAEAARELGCAEGTVESRLARARARLRSALVRQGFTVPAALLTAGAVLGGVAGRAPAALVYDTVKAATAFAAGQAAARPGVAALAEGVLRAMLIHRIKRTAVAAVVLIGLLGFGVARYGADAGEDQSDSTVKRALQWIGKPAGAAFEGEWRLKTSELGGKPNPATDWLKDELRWVVRGENVTVQRWGQSSAGTIKFSRVMHEGDRVHADIDVTLVEGPVPGYRSYPGICKREGDRLTVCYATTGTERPTAFATKTGKPVLLAVFVRAPGPASSLPYPAFPKPAPLPDPSQPLISPLEWKPANPFQGPGPVPPPPVEKKRPE